MTIKIHTAFDLPDDVPLKDFEPTKTKQEFLEESDVNNILDQYETSGVIPETRPGEPAYADFTDPVFSDFQRAQNIVIDANYSFQALPARVRERFNNDPAALIAFVQDDSNRKEAEELGLIREDRMAPPAAPPAPDVPPVTK